MSTTRTARRIVPVSLAAALALVAAACGGSAAEPVAVEETTTTVGESTTTTSTLPPILAPLTGLPVSAEITRPALIVKIDNHPLARPQTGLSRADIVFEENVEMLTRFAAVFHSNDSDPVGPIRSGRKQDVDLLASYNRPLFVWSGGNAQVTRDIRNSTMVDLSQTVANNDGGYYRESSRRAPHNLYAETSKLWTLAPEGSLPPVAQFAYRAAGEAVPVAAKDTGGVKLSMDGVKVHWEWSENFLTFLRSQDDKAHVDIDDTRISAPNVVILYVSYGKSGISPVAKTVGEGEAWVATSGKLFQGTWSRETADVPFELKDSSGAVIKLTPGTTWVELVRVGKGVSYLPGTAGDSVTYP